MESCIQDFVLETRCLKFPEHPHAFNPTIVTWQDQLFMVFRTINHPAANGSSSADSFLYIVPLDSDFRPTARPQRLVFYNDEQPSRCDDPRLIVVAQRLYLIFSDNPNENVEDGGFRTVVAELHYDGNAFHVLSCERLIHFEGESRHRREKNWVPFAYEDILLLAYGIAPHKILYPFLDGSGECETYVTTHPSIVWEWGDLRGGTPAIKIDEQNYLAFFHSSIELSTVHSDEKPSLHYFMGGYLFDADPPFRIKKVSPEPICGKNFYHGDTYVPYWKPVNVVFPCGIVAQDDIIWISYGRQDHEIWLAKIDLKKFQNSLVHVSQIKSRIRSDPR